MNLVEFQSILCTTHSEDWTHIPCWGANSGPSFLSKFTTWESSESEFMSIEVESHSNVISLKSDLLISAAWGLIFNDDYKEFWANAFPDPCASGHYIDFFYSGQLVYRAAYIVVDGGRMKIPMPRVEYDPSDHSIKELTVSRFAINFFRALNNLTSTHDFDRYVRNAQIEIIEEDWLS